MDNLLTGDLRNIEHLFGRRAVPLLPPGRHGVHPRPGPRRLHPALRLAGEPDRLPRVADPDAEGRRVSGRTRRSDSRARRRRACLLASTSEVYGDPLESTRSRKATGATSTRSARAAATTKRSASPRRCTMAYHRHHGVETRIVRIFNTYGPRMRLNDGRVLPAFMGQALRGEDLTVFGDGSQTRSVLLRRRPRRRHHAVCCYSDEVEPTNIGNPRRDDDQGVRRSDPEDHRVEVQVRSKDLPQSTTRRCAARTSRRRRAFSAAGSRRSPARGRSAADLWSTSASDIGSRAGSGA